MYIKRISDKQRYYFSSECNLQKFLHENSGIIKDSLPIHLQPEKLISVERELFNLDNLYIDENGILYLVEVKRFSDNRGRRSVLAQALDYGAVFRESVLDADHFISLLDDRGSESLETIKSLFSDSRIKCNFEKCLKIGSFKIVVVADEINKSLIELCDYTFESSRTNYELTVIELKLFGDVSKTEENLQEDSFDGIIGSTLWFNRGYFPIQKTSLSKKSFEMIFDELPEKTKLDVEVFLKVLFEDFGVEAKYTSKEIALYYKGKSLYTFLKFNYDDNSCWDILSTQIYKVGNESELYKKLLSEKLSMEGTNAQVNVLDGGKRLNIVLEMSYVRSYRQFASTFTKEILSKRVNYEQY